MEWKVSSGITPYRDAMDAMEVRQKAVQAGNAEPLIWLLEHPPLYTAGRSAKAHDLLQTQGFEVHEVGRGGQYTYHGPGQRVVYVVLDLSKHGRDVRAYVKQLEQWIIDSLALFGIESFTREGRVGVWVQTHTKGGTLPPMPPRGSRSFGATQRPASIVFGRTPEPSASEATRSMLQHATSAEQINAGVHQNTEAKIAALGVRVQKWVTSHGIAINVNPDLSHYSGIVPCGLAQFGVTSLADMGIDADMAALDAALQQTCPFGTV